MGLFAAITTIHPATRAMHALAARLEACEGRLVIAGDRAGPASAGLPGAIFLGYQAQLDGPCELGRQLPAGHYSRKNLAYLEGVRRGATCLYETDDDNAPLPSWGPRTETVGSLRCVESPAPGAAPAGRWVNGYRYFSADLIWPRGLPLDEIHKPVPGALGGAAGLPGLVRAPIQQGLVNGSPDVDAVWRLVLDRPFEFGAGASLRLEPGNWCPFNSQTTWWWPVAYPLLYIPSHCSFRMCDIWRGFVAQRCLWALGLGLVFHAAEVVQERNPHDLMRDFRDEIPGYDRNRALAALLAGVPLEPGEAAVAANLQACYAALVKAGFFPEAELALVDAWRRDLEQAAGRA